MTYSPLTGLLPFVYLVLKMDQIIRIHYLYRDSGNYKKFGHKDFLNYTGLSFSVLSSTILSLLLDNQFFYPNEVGIRKFRFHRYCDDYSWYEIETIELIERSSKGRLVSIQEFIDQLTLMKNKHGNHL